MRSADESEVWRHAASATSSSATTRSTTTARRGLPPEEIADEPADCVLFETIRRFKGLEREVVVLVELPETARAPR